MMVVTQTLVASHQFRDVTRELRDLQSTEQEQAYQANLLWPAHLQL